MKRISEEMGGVAKVSRADLESIGDHDSVEDFKEALRNLTSHGSSCIKIPCKDLKDFLDSVKDVKNALEGVLDGKYANVKETLNDTGTVVSGLAGLGVTPGGAASLTTGQQNFVNNFEKSDSFNNLPSAKITVGAVTNFQAWAAQAISRNKEEQKLVERESTEMSMIKLKNSKLAIPMLLVMVAYFSPYFYFRSHGAYSLTQSGRLRGNSGSALPDVNQWSPAYCWWQPDFVDVWGNPSVRHNTVGAIYAPLLMLDRKLFYPDVDVIFS